MLRHYVQWKMSSSIMRRYPDPDSAWNLLAYDAELWNCGYEICKNHLDGSAVLESTQQRSRIGRTNIFLGSCTLGLHSKTMRNKQRYFGQLQNHVRIANFNG